MKHLYLFIFCCFFCCDYASAQVAGKLLDVNYQKASIDEVVTDLEAKTGNHFYYDPVLFDSLKVTVQASRQSLSNILELAFKSTDYHYAINGQEILLTKGKVIQTDLADGFFGSKPLPGKAAAVTQVFDEKEKTTTEATIENKIYDVGLKSALTGKGTATIAGYVKEIKTGEPIAGAILYVPDAKTVANTLTIPMPTVAKIELEASWKPAISKIVGA